MSSRKLVLIFLLGLLGVLTLGLSASLTWIKRNREPVVRQAPAQPLYVLGVRKVYDNELQQGKKPLCPGPIPLLYNGMMAFRSVEEARTYMIKHPTAYPRRQYDVYRTSGDFALDTRAIHGADGTTLHVITSPVLVEGKGSAR